VRAVLPYLLWLPALFWVAPPILWLANGWHGPPSLPSYRCLTWIVVYAHERAPVWYALLYPLGSAVVAFITLRSAWRGAD